MMPQVSDSLLDLSHCHLSSAACVKSCHASHQLANDDVSNKVLLQITLHDAAFAVTFSHLLLAQLSSGEDTGVLKFDRHPELSGQV